MLQSRLIVVIKMIKHSCVCLLISADKITFDFNVTEKSHDRSSSMINDINVFHLRAELCEMRNNILDHYLSLTIRNRQSATSSLDQNVE